MPKVIRLPAIVPEDELRVTFERNTSMAGAKGDVVASAGDRHLQRVIMNAICEKPVYIDRMKLGAAVGYQHIDDYVSTEPSLLDSIKKSGYDPDSMVFSVQRTGGESPPPSEDTMAVAENAQAIAANILDDMESWIEVHGVTILAGDEIESLKDKISQIVDALGSIINNGQLTEK